jgi:integrase
MDSTRKKASAGTVTVLADKDNRLRLRWSVAGKRYDIAAGLPDTPVNRRAVEAKARQKVV